MRDNCGWMKNGKSASRYHEIERKRLFLTFCLKFGFLFKKKHSKNVFQSLIYNAIFFRATKYRTVYKVWTKKPSISIFRNNQTYKYRLISFGRFLYTCFVHISRFFVLSSHISWLCCNWFCIKCSQQAVWVQVCVSGRAGSHSSVGLFICVCIHKMMTMLTTTTTTTAKKHRNAMHGTCKVKR